MLILKSIVFLLVFYFMHLTLDPSSNIQKIRQLANSTFPNNPVLRDLSICQAILESRLQNVPSKLALEYSNLFGMKPGTYTNTAKVGGTAGIVYMPTTECSKGKCFQIKQPFIANKNIEDSFQQYKLLMSQPHYVKVSNSKTIKEAAQQLVAAHFATDPSYANKLISIYNDYVRGK